MLCILPRPSVLLFLPACPGLKTSCDIVQIITCGCGQKPVAASMMRKAVVSVWSRTGITALWPQTIADLLAMSCGCSGLQFDQVPGGTYCRLQTGDVDACPWLLSSAQWSSCMHEWPYLSCFMWMSLSLQSVNSSLCIIYSWYHNNLPALTLHYVVFGTLPYYQDTFSTRSSSVLCRLENATLAVVQSGDSSLLTPDLKGTGTTVSFTNAVIKQLEKKSKGRYD